MTRTLTRRGLFGAAGALLAAPVFPTPLHAAFARGTVTGRVSSSQPNVCSIPRNAYAPEGRWVHSCGAYTRREPDGAVRIFKTRAMGPTGLEVMPEEFEP